MEGKSIYQQLLVRIIQCSDDRSQNEAAVCLPALFVILLEESGRPAGDPGLDPAGLFSGSSALQSTNSPAPPQFFPHNCTLRDQREAGAPSTTLGPHAFEGASQALFPNSQSLRRLPQLQPIRQESPPLTGICDPPPPAFLSRMGASGSCSPPVHSVMY